MSREEDLSPSTSQGRTVADDLAAGGDPGTGGSQTPGAGAQLPTAEFSRYLWESEQPPRALHQASGYAVTMHDTHRPPKRPHHLPFGAILLYPRYLAFLAAPRGAASNRDLPLNLPAPMPIARDAYQRLPEAEREKLLRPLREPGSLAVPIDRVAAAAASRWFEIPGIELLAHDGAILLGPHPQATRIAPDRLVSRFTSWEPRLLGLIRSLIANPAGNEDQA